MTIGKQQGGNGTHNDMQLMKRREKLGETSDKKDELPSQHLKLKLSQSFLSLIGLMLAWHKDVAAHSNFSFKCKYEELKIAQNQHKWKKSRGLPTRLPTWTLHIGNKKIYKMEIYSYITETVCN